MKTLALAALLLTALLSGCAKDGAGPDGPAAPTATTPAGTAPSAAAGPVTLTLETPKPTLEDRVALSGTVDRPVRVFFAVLDGDAVAGSAEAEVEGSWTVEVPLPRVGHNRVEAFTNEAAGGAFANVTAVRLGAYTVDVAYGGYPGETDSMDIVLLDPDALLSAPSYEEQGAAHPGYAVVHDLLVAWEDATGNTVEYGWSAEFGAYSVNRINGAGNPVTAALPPWWCYKVNGERADLGISLQTIAPGDVVSWDLGACA